MESVGVNLEIPPARFGRFEKKKKKKKKKKKQVVKKNEVWKKERKVRILLFFKRLSKFVCSQRMFVIFTFFASVCPSKFQSLSLKFNLTGIFFCFFNERWWSRTKTFRDKRVFSFSQLSFFCLFKDFKERKRSKPRFLENCFSFSWNF